MIQLKWVFVSFLPFFRLIASEMSMGIVDLNPNHKWAPLSFGMYYLSFYV